MFVLPWIFQQIALILLFICLHRAFRLQIMNYTLKYDERNRDANSATRKSEEKVWQGFQTRQGHQTLYTRMKIDSRIY